MNAKLNILRLKGAEIIPYIPTLAKLRIEIFKAYPYLYIGDLRYEMNYLQVYVNCSESIVVLVLDHDKVVGASTAIPLAFETIELKKPFIDNNINIKNVFYFGESVLQPEYRGRNIYRHFFEEREKAAKENDCTIAAFAAIERAKDDPRRPKGYVSLDSIWKHFGYEKHPELCAYFAWKEVGESTQTTKPLIFWLKTL